MNDDPEKAELRKRIAQSQKRIWAMQIESAEIERRLANFQKAEAALMKFYTRGPRTKKKSGRPAFWKSSDGLDFVRQVEAIRKERKKKIATAIRIAKKITIEEGRRSKALGYTNPLRVRVIARAARLAKLSDEELQARYQEARKFWLFWVAPEAYEKEREALERNFDQALAALQKVTPKPTVPDVSYDFS